MSEISIAFKTALLMLLTLDPALVEIVSLSLRVSLSAVLLAGLAGLPLGAIIATTELPGRRALIVLLNGFMGLPPVVVGLTVYLLLSRAGPLGSLGLLFTPGAMICAQCLLVLPIIAALSRQVIEDLWEEYREQLVSLGARRYGVLVTLLWEGRYRLLTVVLAGFGRAVAEVGAVLTVGGNIAGETRVMTTAIALETARGDLPLALGLGLLLILIALVINALVHLIKDLSARYAA